MTINEGTGTWEVTTWPWPQVVFGSYYTIAFALVGANLWAFELYCDTSDIWQGSAIVSLGTAANISHVEVSDFHSFYAISTFGEVTNTIYVDGYIRNPGVGAPLYTALPTSNIPAFGTGCNFNGQGIIGCIKHGDDATFGDMSYNTVAWSAIGKYDFKAYDVSRVRTLETTAGYTQMDWGEWGGGIVYKVKKLGNVVMVYGDGGITKLTPVASPVVTYGKENVEGIGIKSANHIAGDDNRHLFIDNKNDVWIVDSKLSFTKLGYREWIDALTNSEIRVSYEPNRKRFFISDSSIGYGLTEQGLYTTNQLVTSVGNYRGKKFCGFFADDADYEWRVETDVIDFRQRGIKTLTGLEVGGHYVKGSETIQTSVKYKSNYQSNTFAQTSWIPVNPHGISTPIISASEFKLLAKGADYRSAVLSLDYLIARVKYSDKRNVRGLSAGKVNV